MNNQYQECSPELKGFFIKWSIGLGIAEILMFWRNRDLVIIYGGIGLFFLARHVLRQLKRGRHLLGSADFTSAAISVVYIGIALLLQNSLWRYFLILCSSGIIMPQLQAKLRR